MIFNAAAFGQNINNPNKPGPLGTQVNTLTGNLFLPRTDIFVGGRGLDIDISFYYNSYLMSEDLGFGNGWNFYYAIRYNRDTLPGRKLIVWGDGREDKYDSLPDGKYQSPRGFFTKFEEYQPGKYKLTETDNITYYFDNPTHRKVTRIEDLNGNFINFSYTDSLLTSLVNGAGQSINFTYNPAGRLTKVTDAIAAPPRTFNYSYDPAGNLKEVADPLGGKYEYTYLINGPMATVSDKNDNKINIIYASDMSTSEIIGCNKRMSFSYDTATKTTIVTDYLETGNQITKYTYEIVDGNSWISSIAGNCCGFNLSYDYDEHGNMIRMKDANGNIYTYTYDERGNLLTATDPIGGVTKYTYNSKNLIETARDPEGNIFAMTYDAAGNLTQMVAPGNNIYKATYNSSGDIISSTDPKGNTYTYSYDAYGYPTTVSGPEGYQATLSFDSRGRLLSYVDSRGHGRSAEFDILGRLKKLTDPINNTVQFTYDAEGNLVSYKTQNNETSTFSYDASNRVVSVSGPTGNIGAFAYDEMDNLRSLTSPEGNKIIFNYNNLNRLAGIKLADDHNTVFSYDGNGNVTRVDLPNGNSFMYEYDKLNRVTSVRDNEGVLASFTYDKNGNVISYTNGAGAVTTATYDSLDRMRKVTDPLGNSFSYAYDKNGNVTTLTDREGRTSHYTYDDLDRVKTFTDNNGFTLTYGYDAEDNVISLTDQNNNTTSYTYDSLNKRKTMTFPDGKFLQYGYDKKGNLTSVRQADGSMIFYQYDALNNLISRTLPNGEVYSFTYDRLNRIVAVTNNAGTINIEYDDLGRVVSESFNGRINRYEYNITGRTQTTFYPDSTMVTKEYDSRNRIVRILNDSTVLAEYAYDNANQMTGMTYANGTGANFQYDLSGRLISVTANGQGHLSASYTYDKEDNVTTITRADNPSLSESFQYDNGYRLVNYKRGPGGSPVLQQSFTYDAVGNRLSSTTNGVQITYTINNLNQITSVNGVALNYDDRGNLIFDGNYHKRYDPDNRLIRDSISPSNFISYQYDGMNRRIAKITNGNVRKYNYSGAKLIEELDGSDLLLNRTIFSGFLSPLVNEHNGEKYFYHANELGSVEGITNENGRLVETYRYDVFGKPSRFDSLGNPLSASIAGNRFGFTGQEYDSATGSYRFYYRNYSPATGVFNQRDLIEYEDGMGMYQYVGNNPANGIDVWGLEDCPPRRENISLKVSFFNEVILPLLEKGGDLELHLNTIEDLGNIKFHKFEYKRLMEKSIHNRFKLGRKFEAARQSSLAKNQMKQVRNLEANVANTKSSWAKTTGKGLSDLGKGMNVIDNLVKGEAFASSLVDGQSNPQYTQEIQAGGDFALSLLGWAGPGAVYGTADFFVEAATGKGITEHTADAGQFWGDYFYNDASERDRAAYEHAKSMGKGKEWLETRRRMEERERRNKQRSRCPEGGTRKPGRWVWDTVKEMWVLIPIDPNMIIGPEGVKEEKWVSVNDRMPYTILFENDTSATAPAKYVRITTPIEPKQDPLTFELGSFGFNRQSFDIPQGTVSYYTRLDVRDSANLFVDLVAGYDQIRNEAFWEFQSIDPVTLLPSDEPLAGFLFLQDTSKPEYGNGFVNFSIKPRSDAITLDTISASAEIVFDSNEPIPTNFHKNTIDAFAPTSQLTGATSPEPGKVKLTWTGADDTNGVGIDYYTIYVSSDETNYSVLFPRVYGLDTTFSLSPDSQNGTNFCFFILATDLVGNSEELQPGVPQCLTVGSALPVTWLYFNGTNQGKNNILKWATASEENTRDFRLERSLNGTDYTVITVVPAAGNSSATNHYQYVDQNIDQLNSQVMYYRVKQTDIDGRFTYSSIVQLTYRNDGVKPSIVYPNPTTGMVNILVGDRNLIGTTAVMTDLNGRVIQHIRITSANQSINMQNLVNGIYLIRLGEKETLKIVKQ